MDTVDLNFLARQIENLITEQRLTRDGVAQMKDDINVLTAIVLRLEGGLSRLADQVHRMNDRVRKLENAAAS